MLVDKLYKILIVWTIHVNGRGRKRLGSVLSYWVLLFSWTYGRFTLTETEIDTMAIVPMALVFRCSMTISTQFYTGHLYRSWYRSLSLSVWTHCKATILYCESWISYLVSFLYVLLVYSFFDSRYLIHISQVTPEVRVINDPFLITLKHIRNWRYQCSCWNRCFGSLVFSKMQTSLGTFRQTIWTKRFF